MTASTVPAPFDKFLVTAENVAKERPDVDVDVAREVFLEVATTLYNGLALEGLDDHDADAVVAGLCVDLVTADPGAAVRARVEGLASAPGDLHDPAAVSAAYQISASMLKL